MMNEPRMFKVERCEECPHWSPSQFPKLDDYCSLAESKLTGMVKIPDWCPLPVYYQEDLK